MVYAQVSGHSKEKLCREVRTIPIKVFMSFNGRLDHCRLDQSTMMRFRIVTFSSCV